MNKQKSTKSLARSVPLLGLSFSLPTSHKLLLIYRGNKAQPFQPLSAAISCLIWVIYGWTKEPKKRLDFDHFRIRQVSS